ncbi:MAG TPA: extracellular solute-binding protein, partial [Clostridia bacterium]|nr:extracellular solute-binding protein [Clostridia bacterium]
MKWTVRLACMALVLLLVFGVALADMDNGLTISGVNEFPIVEEKLTMKIWTTARQHITDPETNAMAVLYEEKTNVHLEMTLSKDKSTELNLMLASRDYPDMFLTTFSTDQVTMFMEGGVLMPLNDLIAEHGYHTQRVLDENPNFVDYLTTPDGSIYTLFETDVGLHMPYRHKLHVYKPWFEQMNIAKPETIDEFRAMLELIRDTDLNGNGIQDEIPLISDNTSEGDPIAYLMSPFQLLSDEFFHITDDGRIVFEANTDAFREGLRWIKELNDDGLFYAEETYVQDREQLKALVNKTPGEFLVGS